jgi:hypothetical protein
MSLKQNLLSSEECLFFLASLRRYDPDQVRGSRTTVLLSAGWRLPVLHEYPTPV